MTHLIGGSSMRRSPRSQQTKKFLNKGANVLYVGSTDIKDPYSIAELNTCISTVNEDYPINTKIFINSEDYLRVVNSSTGKIVWCVPVDVIVSCVNGTSGYRKYIVFSASTRIKPNSSTIHMAHIFQCSSDKQVEDIYRALSKTIEQVQNRTNAQDDVSHVAPQFTNDHNNFVAYQSHIIHDDLESRSNNRRILKDKLCKPASNHVLFHKAFDYLKNGDQEKLQCLLHSELHVLSADDACQTLLHFSVRLDKFTMCKFLILHCCSTEEERDMLRSAKDKEGVTALHIAATYGQKNFVKFLATDYRTVNIRDIKGRTPLHYCAGKIVHREILHILVDHGAEIHAAEMDGVKPISIEPDLEKIQELSVSGAFVFINNLNFLEQCRSGRRIDSGVDTISCSEKTNSEPEIAGAAGLVHSPDSCYSPHQDSLSSIPEQDRLRPPQYGSYASSHEEDSLCYNTEYSNCSVAEKMKNLREELSRLINMLNNAECHKYLLPEISREYTYNKLITVAQHALLTDDCANAVALIFHQLFKYNSGTSTKRCLESGLLRALVRLLDSHIIIQSQAISIIEELLTSCYGDTDYITEFAELDPELLLELLQENDLPVFSTNKQSDMYAKRLRSLSSPSDFGENLKNGNSYFTKNWSRRLLIRILSRTSFLPKMRVKLGTDKICKQLFELLNSPTREIKEHAVLTLANMALSYDNHAILLKHGIEEHMSAVIAAPAPDTKDMLKYNATRALVYFGYTDMALYMFRDITDILWSEHKARTHVFVRAATLEDIISIMTNDPKLLWGSTMLKENAHLDDYENQHEHEHPTKVDETEIIRFILSLHHTFADTIVFLRLLIHRFRDPSVGEVKRKSDIPPVHAKVCTVLIIWMESFPHHFVEQNMFAELDELQAVLEDCGGAYCDMREQIAIATHKIVFADNIPPRIEVTHIDQFKHCRASLMNEEFPLSVHAVSWLAALRGVIESSSGSNEYQPGFFRSLLSFKDRELTARLKTMIPASQRTHPDVLAFTKKLYVSLNSQEISKRQLQHMFVAAYYSHPLYKTRLFRDIWLQEEEKIPVLVGVNGHHLVVVDRNTNEIIGHHNLTSIQKPVQWFTKPLDNVLYITMDREYRLIGQNSHDIEVLATKLVKHMGDQIEIVDSVEYNDEQDFSETDHIIPANRHSWHSNTNGYMKIECPPPRLTRAHPTTPCRGSYIDISQEPDMYHDAGGSQSLDKILSTTRSRLSLNLPSFAAKPALAATLRRVHTTSDMAMETLRLVETVPRTSLIDKLKSFSTSIASKLDSVKTEDDSDEDVLPKVVATDSLIGPSVKRPLRRSPRAQHKTWERGVVKIDPETAQETVIITEKCNVLYQLKSSSAPTNSDNISHIRVRQMSTFKNIDTAAFTKLLAQSYEMVEQRKRSNRRNSADSAPAPCAFKRPKHTRSKTFSSTFEKLVAGNSTTRPAETPIELEKFSCLLSDSTPLSRMQRAQDMLFSKQCDCPDVVHYIPCPCPPHSDIPYHFSFDNRRLDEAKLLVFHREIARQLTIKDHELFSNISEIELLKHAQTRDLNNHPSIKECKEHFNMITQTVKTMLLQCELRDKRIKILEHFIDISHECALLRNFTALFSIAFAALNSAPIRNLTDTWAGVSYNHMALFRQYEEMTSPAKNYKIYRTLLKMGREPTVPLLSLYIRDFVYIDNGNPDYLKKGLINLQKRRMLYTQLEEIRYFQNKKYNLEEIPELLQFFHNYNRYKDEDEFYIRSEILKNKRQRKDKQV